MFILILPSCTTHKNTKNTQNKKQYNTSEKVLNSDKKYKNILYFNNFDQDKNTNFDNKKLNNTVNLNHNLTEKQKASFIKTYLQERGTYKEKPDGATYHNKQLITEYYMDKEEKKISFVFHIGDVPKDTIYCTTLFLDDFTNIGSLTYSFDNIKDSYQNTLYDTNGNEKGHISYKYIKNAPFPFIEDYLNNYKELLGNVLYINQKFWLYKDNSTER